MTLRQSITRGQGRGQVTNTQASCHEAEAVFLASTQRPERGLNIPIQPEAKYEVIYLLDAMFARYLLSSRVCASHVGVVRKGDALN